MRTIAAIACTFPLLAVALPAAAQDDGARRKARKGDNIVREVNRGLYLKSGVGVTPYFQQNSLGNPVTGPVMTVDLSIGNDIVDQERLSMAVEAQLSQQLHQGPKLEEIPLEVAAGVNPPISGDIHVFAATATFEVSGYLTRRFSIGVRGGGGVSLIPLLMNEQFYQELVLEPNGIQTAAAHQGPQPTIRGGGTIEYYTKLSHFSVGADVDVLMVLGSLGLGLSPVGYLKYTF